ncbi:hypothetical protein LCGC14_1188890 [marine sediment metagenome]|uniref:Uncharacterized protein n=1 Tax=marine sediment metagenome TaxID=412755 RepID=A0A0F9P2R3_9ZZZZ
MTAKADNARTQEAMRDRAAERKRKPVLRGPKLTRVPNRRKP